MVDFLWILLLILCFSSTNVFVILKELDFRLRQLSQIYNMVCQLFIIYFSIGNYNFGFCRIIS